MSNENKSLPPNDCGGIAGMSFMSRSFVISYLKGGEKYICQNILFKFAVDTKINSKRVQSRWMYGGTEKSDRLAAKSAAHDMSMQLQLLLLLLLTFQRD